MKRKTRKNPLVQDPSMVDATDLQLEVVRLVAEYELTTPGEIETLANFEWLSTRDGGIEIWFFTDLGYWYYWNVENESWFQGRGWLRIRRYEEEPLFVYVPYSNRKNSEFMLQRVGDTLRVYELRVVEGSE